jgi:anti-anti-sigma factor
MDKHRPKFHSVRSGDGFAVIRPERRLIGDSETDEFLEIVKQLNEEQRNFLVVDLGEIDWVSTPGLTALVAAHKWFASRGAHVLLARVDKRIHNLLIITKLSLIFDAFRSVEEAVTAGQAKPVKAPDVPIA